MQSSTITDTPRIYVACLASYNAGILHGEWIEATLEIEDIWKGLRNMLASSPEDHAEEWAIHDYEGFGSMRLSEYEGIERVRDLACFIEEHGRLGELLLDQFCGDLEEAERALDNNMGCYASLADYARELTEETTEIPQSLEFYIDYNAMARDMEINDVFTIETRFDEVYVFLNN